MVLGGGIEGGMEEASDPGPSWFGGGGGGTTPTTTTTGPTTSVEEALALKEQEALIESLGTGVPDQIVGDALILLRQKQLKEAEKRRGEPFTKLEKQKFLGGWKSIRELRLAEYKEGIRRRKGEATIKGTIISPFSEFYAPRKEEVTAPPPSIISAYGGPSMPMKLTGREAIKWSARRIPTGFQMSATGLITEFDVSKGIRYIFDPYKHTGKLKGEEKITVAGEPQFGTIISPSESDLFKGTKFEYAEMKGYGPSSELYERTGVRISRGVPVVVETGALIGASVTPAGAAVVSGYIYGRGMKQTIEAPTIPKKALGVVMMGAGVFGMGATMGALQRSITMEEIRGSIAAKPQLKLGIRETLKGGIIKETYGAKYQIGGTKIIKSSQVISKQLPKGRYAIIGRGEVYAKTYEFMTGREVLYGVGTKIKGLGKGFGIGTGGFQPSISVGKVSKQIEFMTMAGKGKLTFYPPSAQVSERFVVGGISRELDKGIISIGGKVIKIQKPWITRGGIVVKKGGFKFDVEEIGLTKIKQPTPSDIGFIKTTGIKSSQQFLKQLYSPPSQVVAEKLIQAPTLAPSSMLPFVSAAGVGVVAPEIKLKEIIKPSLKTITIPRETEVTKATQIVKTITVSSEKERTKVIPVSKIITIPKEKLISAQALGIAHAQIPKQGLKSALISTPTIKVPSPSMGSPFSPTIGVPFFLRQFLKPRRLKQEKKIIKVRRMIPRTKYRPSFVALVREIKASRIPKGYFKGMGALIVRPMISPRRRKKKEK